MSGSETAPGAVAEIEGLTVSVGGRRILDGVSLRVRPGRVTALVGPSGSGKTTTGRALLGEFPAGALVSGTVRVGGERVGHVPSGPVPVGPAPVRGDPARGTAARGAPVGHVPQDPAAVLNPVRRVGALLHDIALGQVRGLPRRARRQAARARVLEAMAAVQLPDGAALVGRFPHQLSGGQQQRIVLAQALLLGARVVVADEPTTGQDALTRRRVVEELAAVAARGIGVVLLSHDLAAVRALADDVLVLRDGRVVERGPAQRVLRSPATSGTRELPPVKLALTRGTAFGAPRPEVVLRVRDLHARHPDGSEVLHVPDLALRGGECLAVLGRSGSGKTTLARCLAGLHRTYDGQVLLGPVVLPRSLRDRDRRQLAAVQYVFQDARASFDERRPVRDQVARTAVRLRGVPAREARAEASAMLGALGLSTVSADRCPGGLSGGELQRAALARALLARPRVLVCDEVTAGLDTDTRRDTLDLLDGLLRTRGDMSLVLVTHDLVAARFASRVAVLDAGEVVEQGSSAEVLTAPRHPLTAALVAASKAVPVPDAIPGPAGSSCRASEAGSA
ncbi:ATP-binding cassette domain-containing protein [Streptomyces fructofermentans]|uniref:ABC transporter ATP-binding protein n=1 Tax=Streptomyces fructofermentans TaxID=152141 RepID=UPI0033E6E60E